MGQSVRIRLLPRKPRSDPARCHGGGKPLETDVNPRKDVARKAACEFLKGANGKKDRPRLYVRINGLETGMTDPDLDAVYYYRWSIYRAHQRDLGSKGFITTEFADDVPWQREPWASLNDATDFHIAEGRWLRDRRFVTNTIDFMYEGGNDRHFTDGMADAVWQNLDIVRDMQPQYVVILAGDHIYKMDYSIMLADHVASGRGVTVGCIEVPRPEATGFGVMAVDEQRNITSFVEKPADPPPMPGNPASSLASMGIYIFNADYLYRLLDEDAKDSSSDHDFGKNLIPKAVSEGQALAHPFSMSAIANPPYSRANGTPCATHWSMMLPDTSARRCTLASLAR